LYCNSARGREGMGMSEGYGGEEKIREEMMKVETYFGAQ
jgi:hypothetical protein